MTAKLDLSATRADRDRYVDLLRLSSICVVVLGHWLMAVVMWDEDGFSATNALDEIGGLWVLTWVLQVMPLFFFVGGFSNLRSWDSTRRKGLGYATFLSSRVTRLIAPVLVFVIVWIPVAVVLEVRRATEVVAATELLAKPLWFLAVYVLAVALAPVMIALHRRHRWMVPIVLVVGAAVVDVLRISFDAHPLVGYLNFAFVWLFAHQLGFFYADGTLTRMKPRTLLFAGIAGLVAMAGLVATGIYSPSMVGMATAKISNNSPPSVCLVALTVWLVGLSMSLRPAGRRLLERSTVWRAVVVGNSAIMTIFLWHLTALFICAAVLLPAGFPQPEPGTAMWWALRPVWVVAELVVLTGLVAIFGRFERASLLRKDVPRADASLSLVLAALGALIVALAGLATYGFAGASEITLHPFGSAFASALYLIGGYFLIKRVALKR